MMQSFIVMAALIYLDRLTGFKNKWLYVLAFIAFVRFIWLVCVEVL
jgi:hypothetical protein